MKQDDGFRTTFSVDLAADEVWRAVARPAPEAAGGGAARYRLPGFEAVCSELEVDPGRLLRVRKDEQPCAGTEIVVVLEASDTGTRVTVVQSGFGPWLDDVMETFRVVWNMIVADLVLYIERGISLKTHLFDESPPRVTLGCETLDRIAGLQVTKVEPESFGDRAGLRPGDLLLKLNGVRTLYGMQVNELMRMCGPGDRVEAVWARDRERLTAAAQL